MLQVVALGLILCVTPALARASTTCAGTEANVMQVIGVLLSINPATINRDTGLATDLKLDDEDWADLSDTFDQVFGVLLPEDAEVGTVGDLVDLVNALHYCD